MKIFLAALLVVLATATASAQDASPGTTVRVYAAAQLCTPDQDDELGPCGQLNDVTIRFVSEDGSIDTTCITQPADGEGSACFVEVPAGTQLTASIPDDEYPPDTELVTRDVEVSAPADPDRLASTAVFSFWDPEYLAAREDGSPVASSTRNAATEPVVSPPIDGQPSATNPTTTRISDSSGDTGDDGGFPAVPVAIGALIVLGLAGTWLVKSRGKPASSPSPRRSGR